MGINFDNLPQDAPGFAKLEDGVYDAEIIKVEMRQGSNKTKPPFLNLTLKLAKGPKMFASFYESDKDFPKYMLNRLLKATGVQLQGTGTLADVGKVVAGKKLKVAVTTNDKGYLDIDWSNGSLGLYPPEGNDVPTDINGVLDVVDEDDDDVVF